MEQLSLDDFAEVGAAIDEAQTDVTPFPIVTEEEIVVAGDANQTDIKISDFTMTFRVPDKDADGNVVFNMITKEFKGVFINPRQDAAIVQALAALLPFYKHVTETGDVRSLTREELAEVMESISDEALDAMYNVVALVIGIDRELKPYMMPGSVLSATIKILRQYKATVNEADAFFARLRGNQ